MCKSLRNVFLFGRRVRIDNIKMSLVCRDLCELHTL